MPLYQFWLPRQRSLLKASRVGDAETVRSLLATPEAATLVNTRDKDGATPLQWAALRRHADVVTLLLAAPHCDVHAKDLNGDTALHAACSRGDAAIVRQLLDARARVHVANYDGRSPLHLACAHSSPAAARLLLEHADVDVRAVDRNGLAPIHCCLHRDDGWSFGAALRCLQLLIARGAAWDAACDEIAAALAARDALHACASLWMDERTADVPLTDVPPETVLDGASATLAYVSALRQSRHVVLRRKICVVGASHAGKTSLIKSLTAARPSLEHADTRTIGIDHFCLRFDERVPALRAVKTHEVTFWDFAGQDEYQAAHALFFSQRTLFLVCVDLEAYALAFLQASIVADDAKQLERLLVEFVETALLRWIRIIFARQPDAEFAFVATKEDLVRGNGRLAALLADDLGKSLAHTVAHIAKATRMYEMRQQLKRDSDAVPDFDALGAADRRAADTSGTTPDVVLVSCTSDASVARARLALERVISRSRQSFAMPDAYSRALDAIVRRREAAAASPAHERVQQAFMRVPALHEYLRGELLARKEDEDDAEEPPTSDAASVEPDEEQEDAAADAIATPFDPPVPFLAAKSSGEISIDISFDEEEDDDDGYASDIDSASSIGSDSDSDGDGDVPLDEIVQTLHHLGDVVWFKDLGVELFRDAVLVDPLLLIEFVRQVITHRRASETLPHATLKGLPFWANLDSETQLLAMKQLLQEFQLVHPTAGAMAHDSDLLVPAFWRSNTPAAWLFGGEPVRLGGAVTGSRESHESEAVRVHWEYHFESGFPATLFDHLVVASYDPFLRRGVGPDWVLYEESDAFACRAVVGRDGPTLQRTLSLEAVLARAATVSESAQLWEAFRCVAGALLRVLRRYPGLVVSSFAWDDQRDKRSLRSLLAATMSTQSAAWMPPSASWDWFKAQHAAASDT